MARIVPDAALKFTANDRFKEMFAPDDGSEIGLGGKVAAGGAAGFVKTIVLYPFDIARSVPCQRLWVLPAAAAMNALLVSGLGHRWVWGVAGEPSPESPIVSAGALSPSALLRF